MNVFITGGTGLIGSAVVAELLGHGHSVLGLARSESSAAGADGSWRRSSSGRSWRSGGTSHRCRTSRRCHPPRLRTRTSRVLTHWPRWWLRRMLPWRPWGRRWSAVIVPSSRARERRQWRVGSPLRRTRSPSRGRWAVVVDPSTRSSRWPARGVRASAVRLPRTVHNHGTGGFAGMLTQIARQTGVSGYAGDGTQRWPAVHALDAAVLFRLALEHAPAGTSWHAVADEGDAVLDIATVIGRRLEFPVESVPQETYGPLGPIFATDQPSSSAYTQETLGWQPSHPSLLEGP